MQYLLSEEEYNELKDKSYLLSKETKEKLFKVCQLACNNVPVHVSWADEDNEDEPWMCIISGAGNVCDSYCDECPVQKECPYDNKQWSK